MAETFYYWITFRVGIEGNSDQRRDSIYDALKEIKEGGSWYEPTSFALFESSKDAPSIVRDITKKLDKRYDLLLCADTANREDAAYFGAVEQADILKSFLPLAVKVG